MILIIHDKRMMTTVMIMILSRFNFKVYAMVVVIKKYIFPTQVVGRHYQEEMVIHAMKEVERLVKSG